MSTAPVAVQDLISFFIKPDPCTEPIPYKIGSFDADFDISEKYFLNALTEAEAIWEKPSGLDLFVYAPDDASRDVLKVNLVYDYRQEATEKLSGLDENIDVSRDSYEKMKAQMDALKARYEKEKLAFQSSIAVFNQRSDVFEKQVEYWNKRGGAPKGEYEKLMAEQEELKREVDGLKRAQDGINKLASEVNALAVALNKLIVALNLSVDRYNTSVEERGETFEEGVYYTDGREQAIDIYEFSSREKLLRVLAHEFGHALTIGHVKDSKAIMYELNEANSKTLTEADLEALDLVCNPA